MKYSQPFGSLSIDEIRSVFEVNVIGIVNCSMACRPSMRAGEGAVAERGLDLRYQASEPYGLSKLAVRG